MRSTPIPWETRRTVNVDPGPPPRLRITAPLERLEPLSVSFPYSDGDLNGVSRTELLYLGVFHKGDDSVYIHDNVLLRLRCISMS